MARSLIESAVTTRAARSKLDSGTHWRSVDPDVHLGYRRSARGGRWLVRWRTGAAYQQRTLGTADDVLDADGVHAFSFAQAVAAARKAVVEARQASIIEKAGPILTVRAVVEDYIRIRENRDLSTGGGSALKRDCRSRLTRHVLRADSIADQPLSALTAHDLRSWKDGLPSALATATKRRLGNDFKAALNQALRIRGSQLPAHLEREIRGGLATSEPMPPTARELQILTDDQVRALIAAAAKIDVRADWDGALHRIVLLLAATGARFSQVARLAVGDVQEARQRLLLPTSQKGRGTKRQSHIPVPIGSDVLSILNEVVDRRGPSEVLLVRPRWRQVGPALWKKADSAPWKSASELTRPWRAILREAGLPDTTVPYALRHSSIVRGLRFGLPTRLVAASHDTSVAMIESHYAAFVVSALEELSSRAVITFAA